MNAMEKSILKTFSVLLLLIVLAFGSATINSCQKNVGDIYDYVPTVLAPDFAILNVDYSYDNDELNTESTVTFKVEYQNGEETENTYTSVLNFYVDGEMQESAMLEDIAGNTGYEQLFEWEALVGDHTFTFEINITSDGEQFVEEENTANNSTETSLDVAVKELVAVSEEDVSADAAADDIAADTSANVSGILAGEGLTISSTSKAKKTTYDNGSTIIAAAVEAADGSIDSTSSVVVATVNPGSATGKKQQASIAIVSKVDVEKKEVTMKNKTGTIKYKDGSLSLSSLKSAEKFTPCTEKSNIELFVEDGNAVSAAETKIGASIDLNGLSSGLKAVPTIVLKVMAEYGHTQGNVDNPPTYTAEIISSSQKCSEECVNNKKVELYAYPGFKLKFSDDRSQYVVLSGTSNQIGTYTKQANCSASNKGTYTFEDCGGNTVSYSFTKERAKVATNTSCIPDVHN